jgi:hypothetical protein
MNPAPSANGTPRVSCLKKTNAQHRRNVRIGLLLSTQILALAGALPLLSNCSHETAQPRVATAEEERRLYPQLYAHPSVVVGDQDPGPNCSFIGDVAAPESDSRDPNENLRARALEMGGNYLVPSISRPSGLTWGYRVKYEARGRVFRCASAPRIVVSDTPSAVHNCEPICSPGYTCLRGICVSACNPACADNEQCDADRICRPKN